MFDGSFVEQQVASVQETDEAFRGSGGEVIEGYVPRLRSARNVAEIGDLALVVRLLGGEHVVRSEAVVEDQMMLKCSRWSCCCDVLNAADRLLHLVDGSAAGRDDKEGLHSD